MKQHLNTLFIATQGAYVSRERENVLVRVDGGVKLRVPIHMLAGVVSFGRIEFSSGALALCGERQIPVSLLSEGGRFRARVTGSTSGNVLLRRAQYRAADDPARAVAIARSIVMAKILNARTVLVRANREATGKRSVASLQDAIARLAELVGFVERADDLDRVRGYEGEAARTYFAVFDDLILASDPAFRFGGRSRRPPRDPVNALLSFGYTMLLHDVRSASEAAGLDPSVGFLHRDRPGRPGLALDLMEEMRAMFVDRLVLTLVNRRMVDACGFRKTETGGIRMTDETRKTLLDAYQKRKRDSIRHPLLEEEMSVGQIWFVQAMLLARYLRDELDTYPPFLWR